MACFSLGCGGVVTGVITIAGGVGSFVVKKVAIKTIAGGTAKGLKLLSQNKSTKEILDQVAHKFSPDAAKDGSEIVAEAADKLSEWLDTLSDIF